MVVETLYCLPQVFNLICDFAIYPLILILYDDSIRILVGSRGVTMQKFLYCLNRILWGFLISIAMSTSWM